MTKLIKDGGIVGTQNFTTSPSLNYQAFYEKAKKLRSVGKYDPPRKANRRAKSQVERFNNYDGEVLRSTDFAIPKMTEVKGDFFKIQRQIMDDILVEMKAHKNSGQRVAKVTLHYE